MEIKNGVDRKKRNKKNRKIKRIIIKIQCDGNKKWCRQEKKEKKKRKIKK